jgi:hypothetical protein
LSTRKTKQTVTPKLHRVFKSPWVFLSKLQAMQYQSVYLARTGSALCCFLARVRVLWRQDLRGHSGLLAGCGACRARGGGGWLGDCRRLLFRGSGLDALLGDVELCILLVFARDLVAASLLGARGSGSLLRGGFRGCWLLLGSCRLCGRGGGCGARLACGRRRRGCRCLFCSRCLCGCCFGTCRLGSRRARGEKFD